ncbi:MAG TPA: hypothetical protein VJQ85_03470, partial [Gaiellaceae bacterium]|nr:hypothetical protein [Gaiellaceae bacterium]
ARLQRLERCLLVPAAGAGHVRAFFLAGGRVAAERTLPPGGGATLEVEAGLAASRREGELDLDELFLVARFLRRPPPEMTIVPLEREAILAAARRIPITTGTRYGHERWARE